MRDLHDATLAHASTSRRAGYGRRIVFVWLADAVVVVHLAYLAFIPVGGMLAVRWRRLIGPHLAAVTIGALSITLGFDCPLTSWEQSLRRRGGEHPSSDGFVAHYLTGKVYPHGYAWAVQVVFAICIAMSYALIILRAPHRARSGKGR